MFPPPKRLYALLRIVWTVLKRLGARGLIAKAVPCSVRLAPTRSSQRALLSRTCLRAMRARWRRAQNKCAASIIAKRGEFHEKTDCHMMEMMQTRMAMMQLMMQAMMDQQGMIAGPSSPNTKPQK